MYVGNGAAPLGLNRVAITDNQAVFGGGIYNQGTTVGSLVSITDNRATDGVSSGYGGGIFLDWGTTTLSL
ncbi:MAG: hypothetical protein R2864_11290 [Syntrophotaleaceae bacterium]